MKLRSIFKQTPSDLLINYLAMCGIRKIMYMEGLIEVKLPPFDEWFVGENWAPEYSPFHPNNFHCWWGPPLLMSNGMYLFKPWGILKHKRPYMVGKINTYPFAQKYGYWEINCKIELGKGLRHAFWGWADEDNTGRERGYREIDFFEIDGTEGKQKINIHYGDRKNGKSEQIGPIKLRTLTPGKWQKFGFYWTPEAMEWYVDNKRVFRLSNKNIMKWFNENETAIWTLIDQAVIGVIDPIESGGMTVDYCKIRKIG